MFDIKGSKLIYNKAEIERIIIEADNVTIAFREGYAKAGEVVDGVNEPDKFIGVGSDHIILKGEDLAKFMSEYDAAVDKFEMVALAVANARKEPIIMEPDPIY